MKGRTAERKNDHIRICLKRDVESFMKGTGFEDIELVHVAAPELDFDEIDIGTTFLGRKLRAPLMLTAMTGGSELGRTLNRRMAAVAQRFGIAFCVGSQRAALENPKLARTYAVRDVAPDVFLVGNLGFSQLSEGYGVKEVKAAVDMISANAISLHMNPLQELIQPEGEPRYREAMRKLSSVCRGLEYPVIIKETGCGISAGVAKKLVAAGASAIDVSGAGGTSWAGVETYRRKAPDAGIAFWDWGIPTAVSTLEVCSAVDIPVISSGGIRSGLDAAKAIALGADLVGVALPALRAAASKRGELERLVQNFLFGLKAAMFLTECRRIEELRSVPLVVLGRTRQWMESRGIDVRSVEEGRD
ncbi:MAG: type 2 isopentenyl-diphosphate Delta-isomerase [Candidatus Hadarchaeales archaeon]